MTNNVIKFSTRFNATLVPPDAEESFNAAEEIMINTLNILRKQDLGTELEIGQTKNFKNLGETWELHLRNPSDQTLKMFFIYRLGSGRLDAFVANPDGPKGGFLRSECPFRKPLVEKFIQNKTMHGVFGYDPHAIFHTHRNRAPKLVIQPLS